MGIAFLQEKSIAERGSIPAVAKELLASRPQRNTAKERKDCL